MESDDYGYQLEFLPVLNYAKHLKRLYLQHNPIGDFSPLENLTNLELELTVREVTNRGYQTSDFSPLEKLTNLRVLALEGGVISDNNALENLANSLENLTNLERLYLRSNLQLVILVHSKILPI